MPETDYRQFRLNRLNSPEFRHIKLLLFWPVFGVLFLVLERFSANVRYHPVHCALDDMIPFCEWFLLPYLFWFVYLVGSLVYTFFFDVPAFRRMMLFIIFTYTVTVIIYMVYPTCQNLRPPSFERDNLLTRIVSAFYHFDTNTNVCPSIHVIGSLASMFALWDTKRFSSTAMRALNLFTALMICISTVFMKQHSVIDVIAALPLCAAGFLLFFRPTAPRRRTSERINV